MKLFLNLKGLKDDVLFFKFLLKPLIYECGLDLWNDQLIDANINTGRLISIIHVDNIESVEVSQKNRIHVLFKTEFYGMAVVVYGNIITSSKD